MTESRDYAIRVTALEGQVRGFAAVTTELVGDMQARHHTWPVVSAALGRTATAAAMMGMMMKNDRDRLTIQVQGDGPIGQVVVDADAHGHVRGYVSNPAVDLPLNAVGKLDVAGAVGAGTLNVVKDLGLKEPYRGSVRLVSGELGDDFTYYLTVSEQVPSSVGVGVLVDRDATILASGGFIIQVMPEADNAIIGQLENRIAHMPALTKLLQKGATPEDLLSRILGDDMRVNARQPLAFQCECSKERIHQTLISLGREEIANIIREQGEAEVICHFCNEAYRIPRAELETLLEEAK
ncbi:Hsp33 family molecular chaperone HslO [Desmospora profundinema]|uniref:33 kDa chaperonin n=1 Tax=Desmospora profundinema TaxID=1571184 RepID=A0ABU1IQP0_9BACL|nr:Hsp33 family molecular chaperone HslO [Desmospora profundinema]MDR6227085.1 molecular chaperone Hsp33 [Desmospora profundinema]